MLKIYKEDFTVRSYQTDLNARMKPSAILEVMQEAAAQHLYDRRHIEKRRQHTADYKRALLFLLYLIKGKNRVNKRS